MLTLQPMNAQQNTGSQLRRYRYSERRDDSSWWHGYWLVAECDL